MSLKNQIDLRARVIKEYNCDGVTYHMNRSCKVMDFLQAEMQRTDAVRQIESRGDCVTLRQLAVTGADLPQLRGREVGRMLQLLLAYVLEHPAENQKTRLLTLAPQLWQRESKNNS